ncbi:hypothetical protein KAR91_03590 [Candidatus Pacearchaeota archaeon]|nr:hypothetical protein [Candidatus Pacearchaeota archaeon]
MITKEHLEHWCDEIDYALNGIKKELAEDRIGNTKNVIVGSNNVSFEYLREKQQTAQRLVGNIRWDIAHDE